MEIKESIKAAASTTATEVGEGMKRGSIKFIKHWVGEIFEGLSFATGGAIFQAFRERHKSIHNAGEAAARAAGEGKSQEAQSIFHAMISKFTMAEQRAAARAYNRAGKFFRKQGAPEKYDQLLTTVNDLSEFNQTRFRAMLFGFDRDDRTEFLIDFGNSSPEQQTKMLDDSGTMMKPEQMPGYIAAEQARQMGNNLRTKSNEHVQEIVDKYANGQRTRPARIHEWKTKKGV